MLEQLESIFSEFKQKLSSCSAQADVLNLKSKYVGKKGSLSEVLKGLKQASVEEKRTIGSKTNEYKSLIEQMVSEKLKQIEFQLINEKISKNKIDVSARSSLFDRGMSHAGLHPITQIQRDIEDIFLSMGFDILDGPHIEDDYHNFEALNIPADHPARDMQDTFWFANQKNLLRTHTSTIQVRGMAAKEPPFKFVGPGKVFRCERTDASHESCFHQIEGMMVGKDISVSNLIYFMKTLLTEIFEREVDVRLRPGFFPFVEPGFELDISCLICSGKGCSVCKKTGWVELLPCGMVHPNVLKYGNIDPEEWNGFAFGLGLDRLVMMRYEIDDIRHLHGGDLRFVSQFSTF